MQRPLPLDRTSGRIEISGNHQERNMSSTAEKIADNLSGYVRNNPAGKELIETYPDWARLAQNEMHRRAAKLLEVFGAEELQAIASGRASLPYIVINLPDEQRCL
ncbi:hypothetical protein [Acidovorax sp. FG27]|uniref:hypothetical protein n=1 Tax=Acidovorax sp. FG27 TaxID=3133652 RepID=UPI0030E97607